MNLITIGNTIIKNPRNYSALSTTLVEGGRNSEGYYVGDTIRNNMFKVEATWLTLTGEEWSTILKLFDEASGGSFINKVTFLDQVSNEFITREMYVSDRSANIDFIDTNINRVYYKNCKLSLVEV